ncbi:hypothetical protein H7F10_06965 [Acidithiobacillus sp. HP-6]|uniref:hypothetical protein n=1 Tax=unclassified Acidithiobacillus TaxID=2614800 RepID=UPI001879009A|nr:MULTISPECIES: hypothetical protein [unclassified Acidithiobacillus]MBE7562695.1 hypothetical protein [Acidithiobacillus sp. HP-6]MBE7570509.1 hypothetical protein [Acidithiobacillus sp. HP-2]
MSLVNSSLSQYGYEKGFLNIGYVSGYARDFKRTDSGALRGKIQQTRDISRMVPIEHRSSRRLNISNEQPVKLIGRIRSRKIVWNNGRQDVTDYHAYLDPLDVSSPSVIEMPTSLAWSDAIQNRKETKTDDFNPFALAEGSHRETTLREGANRVKIAGIVDRVQSILHEHNNTVIGVEVWVRLTSNPNALIPVRMVNAAIAQSVRRELRMGRPILVDGKLRARDLKRIDEDGLEVPTGEQVGYIWCRTILNARRGVDILSIPPWINEIMDRYRNPEAASSASTDTESAQDAQDDKAAHTAQDPLDHAVNESQETEEDDEGLPPSGSLSDLVDNL